jgi:predicted regulator of Ras-like GTPase activity (Roadblock/LC7/MglB family)
MGKDEDLRTARLVFYQQDMQRIQEVLDEFMRLSGAKCSLLIDKEGHLIARRGTTESIDSETISALAAGSFAATREMAKLLGEEEFSVLFHQGRRDSVQLVLVGERMLLAIVFDDKTTIGMIRLYGREAAEQLTAVTAEAAKRKSEGAEVSEEDVASAKKKLDDLFKA